MDLQKKAIKEHIPLQIIGICVQPKDDAITKYFQKHVINYPMLYGEEAVLKTIGYEGGLPTKVIINKKGMIVDYFVGELKEDVLKEPLAQ